MVAENKDRLTNWWQLALQVGTAVVLIAMAWAVLNNKVDTMGREIDKKVDQKVFDLHRIDDETKFTLIQTNMQTTMEQLSGRFASLEKVVQEGRDMRITLQTDTSYIKKAVDTIDGKVERLNQKLDAHLAEGRKQ
jgi:hypothetical protein